jgi:hypothetical protein
MRGLIATGIALAAVGCGYEDARCWYSNEGKAYAAIVERDCGKVGALEFEACVERIDWMWDHGAEARVRKQVCGPKAEPVAEVKP